MHCMSKAILSVSFLLFTGFCCSITPPAVAATYNVTVDDSGFSPAELTVEAGDTVVWENVDESDFPHTTTSDLDFFDPNYWDGPLYSLGDTYPHTFNSVGTFSYHDGADVGTGTITVNEPSVPPAITLESPRLMGGELLFEATGLTDGKTNVLSSSTNLISWTEIATNVAAGSSMTFTNATVLPCQFFRLTELP
jgi:plastocyanin